MTKSMNDMVNDLMANLQNLEEHKIKTAYEHQFDNFQVHEREDELDLPELTDYERECVYIFAQRNLSEEASVNRARDAMELLANFLIDNNEDERLNPALFMLRDVKEQIDEEIFGSL